MARNACSERDLSQLLTPVAHDRCILFVQKIDFTRMPACFVDWRHICQGAASLAIIYKVHFS